MNFLDFLIDKNTSFLLWLNGGRADTHLYHISVLSEWFLVCLILFPLLSAMFPSIRQPRFPSHLRTDIIYWFVAPFIYAPIMLVFINALGGIYAMHQVNQAVSDWMHTHLPIHRAENGVMHFTDLLQVNVALQALLMLVLSDILQYWLHRMFHHEPMWKYHAIHHSPTHLDWLTSVRFHPVNIVLYSTSVNAFIALFGFDVEAFMLLQPFNMLYSPLVHANLNWTYGPFRYILAGPVFHRWHHTHPSEGGMKNFAPTFSLLDVIFGTFYMPKGKQPEHFGVEGNPVPTTLWGQVAYPFRQRKGADSGAPPAQINTSN